MSKWSRENPVNSISAFPLVHLLSCFYFKSNQFSHNYAIIYSNTSFDMDGKPGYVTLAIVKELLEAKGHFYCITLQLLMDDMKQEIGKLRKDIED